MRPDTLQPLPTHTTVESGPQVVIKVVSPGSNSLKSIRQHFAELLDGNHRAMETEYARPVIGKAAARALIKEWGLDSDERIYRSLKPVRRVPRKLVHKIIFSMPAGTSPEKLLSAVRSFAREEFAHEHRYALALHTDEPHPHVHMVVRTMKQTALVRLNIRKPLLRKWRTAFARHLHAHDVAATATSWWERHQQVTSFRSPVRRPTSSVPRGSSVERLR